MPDPQPLERHDTTPADPDAGTGGGAPDARSRRSRRWRRPVVAALVLASAGCASLLGGRQPAAAPVATPEPASAVRPPPAWVAYPEAEVAGVKDPHAFRGQPLCQRCHQAAPGGPIGGAAVALCMECHPQRHSNHPVGVVHRTPAKDLPYVDAGRIACHTCHDPHDLKAQKKGLRLPFNDLCLRCHQQH